MKLAIATPLYGGPLGHYSAGYLSAILAFARDPSIEVLARVNTDTDLVRARSRAVRDFLALSPEFTHLLWWDEDVVADPARVLHCLGGMLRTGHDLIAAPYPRKRLDASEFAFAVTAPGGAADAWVPFEAKGGAIEVSSVGLGFTLCSRLMLETMTEHYASTLGFDDIVDNARVPTVALFQLALVGRALLSEDYSFCHRWRAIGGKVHLYVGDGAPLDHVGTHCFWGKREELVREVGS